MDKYMKLMAIKGLIMSMDEQIYQYFQKDNLPEDVKKVIVDKYYDAIKEQLEQSEDIKKYQLILALHKRGIISENNKNELLGIAIRPTQEDIDLKKHNVQEILEETNQIDDSQVKKIMINGIRKPIISDQLTYSELLDLAFDKPNLSIEYTITYSYKDKFDRSGSIILGDDPITIKDDMVFNITDISKA